ncbi:hypothetical protein PVV74_03670 [Roseovarius sp. SK2]|uniref:hypothetical protein n=1 Tax=Roseovarius TaxID=74030 RepID=UPI00237C2FC7|nr:hypothetical protein [Roseovarius sp. SK2]MDD9724548.1 hypothetical protein [Roseovarius sp. SK2]
MRSTDIISKMTVCSYRMAFFAAYVMIAFVVFSAAMAMPASAHGKESHLPEVVAQEQSPAGEALADDTCCHTAGTCIVQFLQASLDTTPIEVQLTTIGRGFATVRYASIYSATDPPPPRA